MAEKKIWSMTLIVLLLLILSGCETCKRTAQGIGYGIATGVPEDARNTWQSVMRADDWVKKNLW